MKKNIMTLLLFAFLINVNIVYSQTLESDSITIQITKYDLMETEYPMLGKQKIITGIVAITKNKKVYEYRYYAPLKNDTLKDVALRDMDDKELFPKFWYNGIEKSFTFDDKKENAYINSDYKEIILSASLIWAKYYIK